MRTDVCANESKTKAAEKIVRDIKLSKIEQQMPKCRSQRRITKKLGVKRGICP